MAQCPVSSSSLRQRTDIDCRRFAGKSHQQFPISQSWILSFQEYDNTEWRLIVSICPVTVKLPPKCHIATVYTRLISSIAWLFGTWEMFPLGPALKMSLGQSRDISPALINNHVCCSWAFISLLFSSHCHLTSYPQTNTHICCSTVKTERRIRDSCRPEVSEAGPWLHESYERLVG